ncbi:hypothetical protein IQ235_08020 [Oscillatoriales cyanobacterium LEGE 11467]|uniref:Uncharacterized protein n=1 Tax=Zarconia navalis LEGE 11467 TaxID=1828826 RepID=A0A928VZW4_9CYAN|nr:hypothetical protein [Zarconia navalis]MBE9040725.1 hypothetical protein [Zarconia navalis LEGE 11467]
MVIFARLFGGVAAQQIARTRTQTIQLFSIFTLGAIATGLFVSSAQAVQKKRIVTQPQNAISYPSQTSFSDGIYLQGESSQPQQIGRAYAIFEVRQEQVVGAFYQPSSSFDCFYGTSSGDRLALNVIDSYSQQAFPYAIAVDNGNFVATTDGIATEPRLDGYYPVAEIDRSDREILATCQANLSR